MERTVTKEGYTAEVREQARALQDRVEKTGEEPISLLVGNRTTPKWFQNGELTGADCGAIVADFNTFNGDVGYRDTEPLFDASDFKGTLERMAHTKFIADILDAYETDNYGE